MVMLFSRLIADTKRIIIIVKKKTQQMRGVCVLCFILEFVRLILFDHYYFHEWNSFTMGLILVAP